MSLVQSAINQIGREMGRDLYRGVKNTPTKKTPKEDISLDEQLLLDIKKFELSSYDKTTIKNLANLQFRTEDVDHRQFSIWEEIFIELDNKIDFTKEHVSKENLPQIELLDKKNNIQYCIRRESHIVWIDKLIEEKKIQVSNIQVIKTLPFILKGFFIWFWTIVVLVLFYNGGLTFDGILNTRDGVCHNLYSLWAIILFIVGWLSSLLYRIERKNEVVKDNNLLIDQLSDLQKYRSGL